MFADKLKAKLESMRDTVVDKITLAPDHIAEERINTCLSCENYFKLTKQCLKCGCFIPAKTKLASSYCPIKKWDIYKID